MTSLFVAAGVTPLIVWFQNCGPQGFVSNSSHNEMPSAFAIKKVQIAEQNMVPSSADQLPRLKPTVQLLAKVNNACAESWCSQSEAASSITCQAYSQGPHPKLRNQFQIYKIALPGALTAEELEQWVSQSSVDQACLRGVSEEHDYKLESNDPYYPTQKKYLDLIHFSSSLAIFKPGDLASVKVGVVDCGVGVHDDLLNIAYRTSFSNSTVAKGDVNALFTNDDVLKPRCNHGTFVAGIISAQQSNSLGMAGIASNSEIWSYGVGNSLGEIKSSEIANAISAAVADRMDVVNLSFGDASGNYNDDPMVRDGFIDGYIANVFFVVAAGNSSQNLIKNPAFPAQYALSMENVMAVAATDQNGSIASFSNYGPGVVQLAAPGVSIFSTIPQGLISQAGIAGYDILSGTSFAAPFATAAAALAIGYSRKKGKDLSVSLIRAVITERGSRSISELAPYVSAGQFLDLNALASSVQQADFEAAIASTAVRGTDSQGNPIVRVTLTWNTSRTASIPPDSRLGVFDASSGCNFSASCLVQSVSWPPSGAVCDAAGNCTYGFVLTKNEVVNLTASKSDPTLSLPVVAAVYHVVMDPATNKPRNVYAVDLQTRMDLRPLKLNLGLPLLGHVTNIRSDMQYLYVSGWACLPGSEEAVTVQIRPVGSSAIRTDYAYDYPYMVPHSSPLDAGDTANWMVDTSGGNFNGWPHSDPYMAFGIRTLQKYGDRFGAGLEGNPLLVEPCQTLTAAHGFDFAVPHQTLVDESLNEMSFQVVAKSGSQSLVLADESGQNTFLFPEAPASVKVSNMRVDRAPTSFTFSGNLCSSSPSPVTVEVTYASYNFVYALTGKAPSFPVPSLGFVSDTNLPNGTATSLPVETVSYNPDLSLKIERENLDLTDDTSSYIKAVKGFSQYPPNAGFFPPRIDYGFTRSQLIQFQDAVNAYKSFVQIGTGAKVNYFLDAISIPAGTQLSSTTTSHIANLQTLNPNLAWRAGQTAAATQYQWYLNYWDYYDVGEPFSSMLVGYDLTAHYPSVGDYVANTYSVKQVLRENKKYETPLARHSVILGHGALTVNFNGTCLSSYQHDLSNLTINGIDKMNAYYTSGIEGFALDGHDPQPLPTPGNVQDAMRTVPVTLRFFQDGRMILHLESDTQSNFRKIDYGFD